MSHPSLDANCDLHFAMLPHPRDTRAPGAGVRGRFLRRWGAIVGVAMTGAWGLAPDARAQTCVLENEHLRYTLSVEQGQVTSRLLENRLSERAIPLPVEQFRFEFGDGHALGSLECRATLRGSGAQAELLFSGAPEIEARVRYTLPSGKAYVRKRISVRQRAGAPRRLFVAELDDGTGVKAAWRSMRADRYRFASHPIHCDDLWTGVEFVAAFNEHGPGGFLLRSRPGGLRLGAEWLDLHSTVTGVAEPGRVRPAFLRYIDDVRATPARMTCCYNSWWTLPKRFSERELLDLAADLKRRLFDPHGVFFDVVAIDAGWSDPRSIWEVDRAALPQGFDPLRRIVESARGKLGLWMSPSAFYDSATDCDWAGRNGFTVVRHPYRTTHLTGLSLADPRYLSMARTRLQSLIRDNGFAHVKFDGFIPLEDKPHHDLLPGDDSVEPLAAAALALVASARAANPDLVTEPTFLNSYIGYISPWAIRHADSLFGNAGGDYPRAIGPAPDYRESCTNAREWYIFSSLDEVWLPQNALQYFDVIHCDAAEGLSNHLAMAVGRGRFFLPAYVNPKHVSEPEWAFFAQLLRWARANRELLRHTVVLPSRVEQGEPYGYAHWLGTRGLLAVRNPGNETRVHTIDLRAAGAPAGLSDAVSYTQYPHRKGIAKGLHPHSTFALEMQPWELAFVEVVPRARLREPVALGARWYRDAEGRMRIAPDAGVAQVEVLEPGGAASVHSVGTWPRQGPAGEIVARSLKALPKGEWLPVKGNPSPSVGFDVECAVTTPADCRRAQILLLVRFPGRAHAPSTCSAAVNGQPAQLEQRVSGPQMGYAGGTHGFDPRSYWAGIIPHQCEWTWYLCEVPPGRARVRLRGAAARPDATFGLWLWSERDCAAGQCALPLPCTAPEMPQSRDLVERRGVCLLAPVAPVMGCDVPPAYPVCTTP